MGAGASVDSASLAAEAAKPDDLSDVTTEEELKAELTRVRALIKKTNEDHLKFLAVNRLLRVLDGDQDGLVNANEFLVFLQEALGSENTTLQKAENSMKFKDGDKNGTLSPSELRTACSGVNAAKVNEWADKVGSGDPVKRLMLLLDADSDGQLNADEFLSFMRDALGKESATLKRAEKSMRFKDGDKNGTLSPAELRTACGGDDVNKEMVAGWCDTIEAARKAPAEEA